MERNYTFYLIGISFLLTNVMAYFDEGIKTFDYLTHLGDWTALIIYTLLFSVVSLLIFLISKGKEKTRFWLALLGYLPVVFLMFYII